MVTSLLLGYVGSDDSQRTVVDDIGVAPISAPETEPGGVQDVDPGLEPTPEGATPEGGAEPDPGSEEPQS